MPALYVLEQGAKLCKQGRRLRVIKDGAEIQSIPLFKLEHVMLFGNVGLTTPALRALLAHDIDVIFLDTRGRYRGRLIGETTPHAALRLGQYRRAEDASASLSIARRIVAAKIRNAATLAARYRRRRSLDILDQPLAQLKTLQQSALNAPDLPSLLGIEGSGSGLYFQNFQYLITNAQFQFQARRRRPPTDPVNALLSFGYVLITRQMESVVRSVGLDPYLGFLHQIAYNRPSLALDLIEEFRAILVDSVVLRCLNNHLLTPAHFQARPAGETDKRRAPDAPPSHAIWLTDEGKAIFLREMERRLNQHVLHPLTGERVTYRRCFELQAREMARCIQAGDPYQPFIVR